MDQGKIGQFILKCRKEKNITQQELAVKLGVTDKAISKWENGRCLMDISLLKPLSQILNVSVMEIINGEKIDKNDLYMKSDKFAMDTLNYVEDKIKVNRIKTTLISGLIFMILIMMGFIIYKGVNVIKYNVEFTDNHKEIIDGLSNEDNIKVYKKTIDENDYLIENDVKIRNVFDGYERVQGIDLNTSVKYVLRDENNEMISSMIIGGVSEQFIDMFSSDDVIIFNSNDMGQFNDADRKYFLLNNDINNDIDFLMYVKNNGYLKNNIFTSIRNMKENYSVNLFTQIVFPVVDKVTFITGDYIGYIFDIGNVRSVNIIRNDMVYGFTFVGDRYFENDYFYDLISTIEIK